MPNWIEWAVEAGRASCYGEVARALGLTESRITQMTSLLGLSPAVQEAVMLGRAEMGDQGRGDGGEGGGWRILAHSAR